MKAQGVLEVRSDAACPVAPDDLAAGGAVAALLCIDRALRLGGCADAIGSW